MKEKTQAQNRAWANPQEDAQGQLAAGNQGLKFRIEENLAAKLAAIPGQAGFGVAAAKED